MALYLGNERITPNLTTTVSGVIPSGTTNITDTSLTDVSLFQYAQVSDGNLVAENIKKDVSILGITGTLEATTPVSGTLQITSNGTFDVSDKQYAEVNVAARLSNPKTVTPKATSQTVLPDQGDDGLSQVTVSGDSNLVAGNIKKDVSIFGVTGTLESSSGGSSIDPEFWYYYNRDLENPIVKELYIPSNGSRTLRDVFGYPKNSGDHAGCYIKHLKLGRQISVGDYVCKGQSYLIDFTMEDGYWDDGNIITTTIQPRSWKTI